jgi:hypothetical protein
VCMCASFVCTRNALMLSQLSMACMLLLLVHCPSSSKQIMHTCMCTNTCTHTHTQTHMTAPAPQNPKTISCCCGVGTLLWGKGRQQARPQLMIL